MRDDLVALRLRPGALVDRARGAAPRLPARAGARAAESTTTFRLDAANARAPRWTPTQQPRPDALRSSRRTPARRTPARSTRSTSSQRSAASAAPGCTWTRPTAASRRSPTAALAPRARAGRLGHARPAQVALPAVRVRLRARPRRPGAAQRVRDRSPTTCTTRAAADDEVNFSDLGLQLTRSARALKLWLSLRYFGLDAFRAAIGARSSWPRAPPAAIEESETLELMAPPSLGIVCFRRRDLDDDGQRRARGRARAKRHRAHLLDAPARPLRAAALRPEPHRAARPTSSGCSPSSRPPSPKPTSPSASATRRSSARGRGCPRPTCPRCARCRSSPGSSPTRRRRWLRRRRCARRASGEDVIEQWSLGSRVLRHPRRHGRGLRRRTAGARARPRRVLRRAARARLGQRASHTRASRRCGRPRRCGCSSSPRAACDELVDRYPPLGDAIRAAVAERLPRHS